MNPEVSSGPRWFSPSKISGIYGIIIVIIIFGAIDPSKFLTTQTVQTVLNQSAINGLIALALVIPLASGAFDLSVGYTLGFVGIVTGWILANTSLPIALVIVIGILVGAAVGLFNAVVVVSFGVDPIIGTLGSGSIIFAATIGVSGDADLTTRIGGTFSHVVATANLHGVTIPVFILVVVMVGLGLVTEQTRLGRYWYALGFDADVARLSGLRVNRLKTSAFVVAAALAGVAGLCLTGQVGAATPDVGPVYLLPAFAGAFLGATQIRPGRFNAWGTVVAVLLLGVGEQGLVLVGGPVWVPQAFQGAALILAVGLTGFGRTKGAAFIQWIRAKFAPTAPAQVDAAVLDA